MLSFLLLNAGALAVAMLVARAVAPPGRLRVLCTLTGLVIVIHSTTLAAGLAGRLTVGGVAVVLVAAVVGVVWWTRRARGGPDGEACERRLAEGTRLVPMVAIVTGAVWAWPHVSGPTRLWIWDDYTYHMVYPALWLRDHAIAAVGPSEAFTMQAWYPLSASVVSTWFMLPFAGARGDALAWVSLTGVLYAGIVASGAAEVLARVGCRPGTWAVPLVVFFTSHRIGVMASSFADADLAVATVLFAAFVFAVPRGEAERRDDLHVDAGYAALLTGLALGVKVSAVPTALIVLAMLAWRGRALEGWRRGCVRVLAIFILAWAVTGGYWYARNVLHTGNPIYPAAFAFWPGATFPHTTLREYAQHWGFVRAVHDALVVYLNWPLLHAVLAVAGLVGLAGWLGVRRRTITRPQAAFAGGALTIVVLTVLLLPGAPYSAGNGMTFAAGLVHWDSMRYIALLPILGWVALAFVLDAGAGASSGRMLAGFAVVAGALVTSQLGVVEIGVVLVTGTAGATVLARAGNRTGRPRRIAIAVATAAATAAVVVFLTASHGAKAAATAAAFHREPLFGAAVAIMDRLPGGTRVGAYGDQWIYPMFGARHDLVPVRLDRNGRIATEPIGDEMTQGDLTVDLWTFRRNLAASSIGLVAVVHLPHPGRSPQWPAQATVLENAPGTRLLYRDRSLALWKLGD